MDEIIYRKSGLTDVIRLIELRKQQLQEEGAEAITELAGPLHDYYVRHFNDNTFISWLGIDNETIIATSGVSLVEKPPYYGNETGRIGIVSSMYTLKPYRRKGVAKKLLGLIVHEAKEHGCGIVQVTASDMGALLYQDFGFERKSHYFQYKYRNT
ncbi:MAG: GNAT family N-acetyltransferase [Peptococcaceae bacterium]|nr:GNAT family N-acetyltransferase [Peptococcaceae bacterium]